MLVTQLYPTLCNPMVYSPPASSVHGISRARTLEWFAIFSPRDLLDPGIKSKFLALAGEFFTAEPPWKPLCQMWLMPIECALEYMLSPKSLLWGCCMWFLSAGGWSGVVFWWGRLSCAAHASRSHSLEQRLCTQSPHCPLNHSAGPTISAHGPWN